MPEDALYTSSFDCVAVSENYETKHMALIFNINN